MICPKQAPGSLPSGLLQHSAAAPLQNRGFLLQNERPEPPISGSEVFRSGDRQQLKLPGKPPSLYLQQKSLHLQQNSLDSPSRKDNLLQLKADLQHPIL
jgi:hypothetical protein